MPPVTWIAPLLVTTRFPATSIEAIEVSPGYSTSPPPSRSVFPLTVTWLFVSTRRLRLGLVPKTTKLPVNATGVPPETMSSQALSSVRSA